MPELTRLPVNEVFETIQGEATHTGRPSVFVRLQGCAVGCPWCDTKHTWQVDPRAQVAVSTMLAKGHDDATFALIDPPELMKVVAQFNARHLVITGGEPLVHDLLPLTRLALDGGWSVQIETSGTQPVTPRVAAGTWVTLSPKFAMPGGYPVLREAIGRADEIKLPVGKVDDIDKAEVQIAARGKGVEVWLQPLSASPKATELCMREAIARGYRLSLQTHRFIGVR